jgi:MFS family permease
VGLAALSLALGVAALLGALTPPLLLTLTLLAGTGAALAGPVWQSIVPELVPRPDLKAAVALNSLGINIARAIGPALGGAVIVGLGVAAAYFLDVATYAVTLAALVWWKRPPSTAALPEHLGRAMRAGVRYALASAPLKRVLLRAVLFFAPASCYWALLPLVARTEIGAGAAGYGLLLAAVGAGAVGGALVMPRLRARLSAERLALLATAGTAACNAALALVDTVAAGAAVLAAAGAAWIMMLTTLNATAQAVLPNWVLVGLTRVLPPGEEDLSPAHHWAEPLLAGGDAPGGGPTMVTIEYQASRSGSGRSRRYPARALVAARTGGRGSSLTRIPELGDQRRVEG